MKKRNIVWIVENVVRNYLCLDDLRRMRRPPLFDRIAEEAVYFENAVTTGTSTIMAVSGMLMSIPAYFLNRNLKDFRGDKSNFESLQQYLRNIK